MKNKIENILINLGISNKNSIVKYFPETRDRKDLCVMSCKKSGVLFLNQTNHINEEYYNNIDQWVDCENKNYQEWLNETNKDDLRRSNQFKELLINKNWLDVGTGNGGILYQMKDYVKSMMAIEPQKKAVSLLKKRGFEIHSSIDDVNDRKFDVVTLFHVLEHLDEPIKILKEIYEKINDDGVLIVEVPHAKDFLISFLNLEDFKKFSFWSEHLILHTRNSLELFIKAAGFKNVIISGFQRYNLANHMYWMTKQIPGGHKKLLFLNDISLNKSYENMLVKNDMCDTLIAYAYKSKK